jgi:hypothetical protein
MFLLVRVGGGVLLLVRFIGVIGLRAVRGVLLLVSIVRVIGAPRWFSFSPVAPPRRLSAAVGVGRPGNVTHGRAAGG